MKANSTVHLQVTGRGGVPATGVGAVILNVTVTQPSGASGNITAYPDGATLPTVSNLNFVRGQTIPNLVVVKVGTNGKVALRNSSPGTVHLIADVAGYYLNGSSSAAGAFTPLSPARILDSRSGLGVVGPVKANSTVHLQVTGRGGVPATGVGAVILNVTVTQPSGASGNITAYPDGTTLPTVSNLNFVRGQTIPNLVVVKVGTNGKVALRNSSPGTVHLIADVAGYYLNGSSSAAGAFTPLSPARILDSRSGLGVVGPVKANSTVHLQVTGRGGVPATGVGAVILNVTVTQPSGASGNITAYPDGTTVPTVSNLNFVRGQTIPNLVVVKVGTNGKVALRNSSPGTVHLIADVAGYSLPAWGIGSYSSYAISNARLDFLSCPRADLCVATGEIDASYNGLDWSTTPLPHFPDETYPGLVPDELACATDGTCASVGYYRPKAPRPLTHVVAIRQNDSWSVPQFPVEASPVAADCAGTDWCLAVGVMSVDGYPRAMAAETSGSSWALVSVPLPADVAGYAFPESVSCAAPGDCMLIGDYKSDNGNARAFATRLWSGAPQVHSADLPTAAYGLTAKLDCPTVSFCGVVGATNAMTSVGLVGTVDKSGLTLAQPTGFELGAGGSGDISCPVSGTCFAVGSRVRDTPSGQEVKASIVHLNAGQWTLKLLPPPPGESYTSGAGTIACASFTYCVAGQTQSLVSTWDGAAWTTSILDDGVASYVQDVACVPHLRCRVLGLGGPNAEYAATFTD